MIVMRMISACDEYRRDALLRAPAVTKLGIGGVAAVDDETLGIG